MGGPALSFTLIDGTTGGKTSAVVPLHAGFVEAGEARTTFGS
jgi:hypothetical protein